MQDVDPTLEGRQVLYMPLRRATLLEIVEWPSPWSRSMGKEGDGAMEYGKYAKAAKRCTNFGHRT